MRCPGNAGQPAKHMKAPKFPGPGLPHQSSAVRLRLVRGSGPHPGVALGGRPRVPWKDVAKEPSLERPGNSEPRTACWEEAVSDLETSPALSTFHGGTHDNLSESKGCSVDTTTPSRSASSSPFARTGLRVSEPSGVPGTFAQLVTAVDPGQKSSSSSSFSSSCRPSLEASVPEAHKAQQHSEFVLLRLQTRDRQRPEWTFYPRFSCSIHTYHVGKQCFFNGVFLGNRRSVSERTVDKSLGRKRYDMDPRNGIPKLTPGDNPYMSPEQSKGFHQAGSTLPPVNFSLVPYQKKFDTFVPLEPLPPTPSLPFWVKEKANRLKNEIREVEELDNWHPATPLMGGLFPSGVDFPRQT